MAPLTKKTSTVSSQRSSQSPQSRTQRRVSPLKQAIESKQRLMVLIDERRQQISEMGSLLPENLAFVMANSKGLP